MDGAPRESSEPGTLLWIGPTSHPEFAAALRFCRDHVAQIAVRKSLSEAIRRPAGYVCRIIFARPTRQTPRREAWEAFTTRYDQVPALVLYSSLCDGEGRTGTPWPVDDSIRFSRWGERLPVWLAPCGVGPAAAEPASSLLVISDRYEMAEPYLDWAGGLRLTTAWQRRFIPALHRGFDTVLWDDSSAPPATALDWRQRLGEQANHGGDSPSGETAGRRRHLWLTLQPSIDAIDQAIAGGVTRVLTKPVSAEAILQVH